MVELTGLDEVVGGLAEALPEVIQILALLADLQPLAPGIGCTSELGSTSCHQATDGGLEQVSDQGGELSLLRVGRSFLLGLGRRLFTGFGCEVVFFGVAL